MPHELFPGETGHPTPSEGHSKAQADRLHDFLSRVADIPVWYDAVNLNQHTMNRKFHVIPLRLDDVTPPDFISNFSNSEIGETELGSAAAAQILQGLYQSPI